MKVAFDIDGVLADFEGKLVRALERQFGSIAYAKREQYSLEKRYSSRPDVLLWAQDLVNDPNFYYGIEPVEGMIEFAKNLMSAGYELIFVSGRPMVVRSVTVRWLKHRLEIDDVELYIDVKDKGRFLSAYCGTRDETIDFAIDDHPKQIDLIREAGVPVLCSAQPWNEGIFPRLYFRHDTGEAMLWGREDVEAQPFFSEEEYEN